MNNSADNVPIKNRNIFSKSAHKTPSIGILFIGQIMISIKSNLKYLVNCRSITSASQLYDNNSTLKLVNMLNDGMPVNSRDEDDWTALHLASWSNKKYIVELLLQNGANVNAQNVDGTTPLHHAARWNSAEAIRILLQHGASRNIRNSNGRTPFDVARTWKKKEAVHLLKRR